MCSRVIVRWPGEPVHEKTSGGYSHRCGDSRCGGKRVMHGHFPHLVFRGRYPFRLELLRAGEHGRPFDDTLLWLRSFSDRDRADLRRACACPVSAQGRRLNTTHAPRSGNTLWQYLMLPDQDGLPSCAIIIDRIEIHASRLSSRFLFSGLSWPRCPLFRRCRSDDAKGRTRAPCAYAVTY